MFDVLSKGLGELIHKLTAGTGIDRKAVEEILVDLKKILLQSDVDIKLTDELIQKIKKKTLDEKLPAGLTLREQVLKVIYEELVKLLGEAPAPLLGKKRIMFVGLFGAGKTTSISKLAKYFQKQGLKPALVALDFHRPAAPAQLKQLGDQLHVPVHINENKNPFDGAKEGIEKFSKYDVIIFDTAGRNALDGELANELKKLNGIIKPDEVLLVIPADLGKVAKTQSEEFHKLVGVTGVFISKMDGTAKAGGALAATSVTGAKVKFLGMGEKVDDLEIYNPERFVSRLLGLGDLETLLEKAKDADIKQESVEKMMEGRFTLQDFMEHLESVGKMGSLSSIVKLIPGMGSNIPQELLDSQESKMKKYKVIIQSMTKKEKENPDSIDSSRIKRIAKGSGVSESNVRELLTQYNQMKKVTKMFKGRGQKDLMKMMKQFSGKMPGF